MTMTKNAQAHSQLFKKPTLPKMPEGYYSGDKPNPNLRKFVEEHLKKRPFDPATDKYDTAAFDKPIATDKDNAIYGIHGYWAKKPYDAIRQYVSHFTTAGNLVLDPFCGSGTTAIACAADRRDCIAVDLSGAASFITRHVAYPIPGDRLIELIGLLRAKVGEEILSLYRTKCHECGGAAEIAFTVWSYTYRCMKCLTIFPIYDAGENRVCPKCQDPLASRAPHVGFMPVETGFDCCRDCRPKRKRRAHDDTDRDARDGFHKYDLPLIKKIEDEKIPAWFPTHEFSNKWISYRPNLGEAKTIAGFFTKRNLRACAVLMRGISELEKEGNSDADALRFCFTAALLNFSKKAQHLEEGGGYIPGNYNFPPLSKERNVLRSFEAVASKVAKGMDAVLTIREADSRVMISTQSAMDLAGIPSDSIDYVFTDPPYSNKVPFGEFNFLYESWLNFQLSWKSPDEIIQNDKLGKGPSQWQDMMTKAAGEMYRVLKPGHWASVCYHDSAEGSWELLQDAFALAGFVPDEVMRAISIEVSNKSFKQRTTSNVQKRDLIINFRKPRPGEVAGTVAITGEEDVLTFAEKVRTIICEYLEVHPGATQDRIFDEVVSRMVRKGQMEAHNFDELLRQVADEVKQPVNNNLTENEEPKLYGTHEIGRWYLKETADEADSAETAKEDAAAESLTRFIIKAKKDYDEGVHYSELFEHFIYAAKDKPRRHLADWLPDYFFKTEAGTWRLPASKEEEQIKAKGRQSGLTRKIKRYISCIEAGLPVSSLPSTPSNSDLAEWVRHCKRAGLYEQGKLLYERGGLNLDQLPEEAQVNVEEDYQVCVRKMSRESTAKPAKDKRKRKSGQAELDI